MYPLSHAVGRPWAGAGSEHMTAEELRDPKGRELPVSVAARSKA